MHHHFRLTFPFCLSRAVPRPSLHSFPTRRSSDLLPVGVPVAVVADSRIALADLASEFFDHPTRRVVEELAREVGERDARSEEHTSELQSPYDLVCRLLLEKKKKKINKRIMNKNTI